MVASKFEGLGGYGTLEYEGLVSVKSLITVVLAGFHLCMACVPSLYTESTNSVIHPLCDSWITKLYEYKNLFPIK